MEFRISLTYTQLRLLLAAVLLPLAMSGCWEIPTSAKLSSGPTFSLRGNGDLASFRVYGPNPGHRMATPFDSSSVVWSVGPSGGYLAGAQVWSLQIVYGQVPKGYVQITPNNGAVSPLPAGMIYYFVAETTNAPPADGFFYLDGTTPIEINVPGLCESGFVGDVRPLKCGTKEPYVEPTDLEQFVRENRVQK